MRRSEAFILGYKDRQGTLPGEFTSRRTWTTDTPNYQILNEAYDQGVNAAERDYRVTGKRYAIDPGTKI